MEPSFWQKLWRRGSRYTVVGISTYIFDIALIWVLLSFGVRELFAVALAFFTAVSINYLCSYYWVFRGTTRRLSHGYMIFIILAVIASFIIAHSTMWLATSFALSIFVARTIVAGCVGIIGFFINSKYNFKQF